MKDLVADYRVTFRLMMKEAKHKYGNDIGMILNPCHATRLSHRFYRPPRDSVGNKRLEIQIK